MKAAVIAAAGEAPVYGEMREPVAAEGFEVVRVAASALSNLSKGRASGRHYSSDGVYPSVPGMDGVGSTADGRRVYFAMPEAPFGAMAELSLVRAKTLVEVPEELSDVDAAALANPGMSAWAAMVVRAGFKAGETVLVNGATGAAGRVAVKLAKHLGAGRVIATGRNAAELQEVGADVVVPFALGDAAGVDAFEAALKAEFAKGIDVVADYLWGTSARTILIAVAKSVEDGHPVRFVQVGEIGGESEIALPAAVLRSSAVQLMGSGLKSVPLAQLLESIRQVFLVAKAAGLTVESKVVPLAEVSQYWEAGTKPRVVFTV